MRAFSISQGKPDFPFRMIFTPKKNFSPLHRAVIEGDVEKVDQLKHSSWIFSEESHGFNPLEIAQFLGKIECQRVLELENPFKLYVQKKGEIFPTRMMLPEFEDFFKITYRRHLTFPSYEFLDEVIHQCPFYYRFERLLLSGDQWELSYQSQRALGDIANTYVKWINPEVGYGLFAKENLPERKFVAEYTGIMRCVDKHDPQLNPYCFLYPKKWMSSKYYVIDALEDGNISRFINHSDRPNLQPLWLVDRKLLHLVFVANRPIVKGTELTFDYGNDFWIHRR